MANSKKRCRACKSYKPSDDMQCINNAYYCDHACVIAYTQKPKVKKAAKSKVNAEKKRAFYDDDIKTRKAAAKKACHDYIKARDIGLPCICCGESMTGQIHAGHYLESGNNPKIRYDEDNINSQRAYCNTYKGGNSDDYRGRLIEKIGLERVERLEDMKGGTIKRSADNYKQIEVYFKNKLKMLQ